MKNETSIMLGILLAGGCASSRLPPDISATDRGRIKSLNMTVGIAEYEYSAYPKSLKTDLCKTSIFKDVNLLSNMPASPDLVAYVEEPIHGTAAVPLLTLLTLGIMPTSILEQHGQVFSLARPDDPTRKVRVEFIYELPSMLGWAALFKHFSPDWSINPSSSRRYLDGLALAISTNAPAIEKLMMR